jgi:MFS family permease
MSQRLDVDDLSTAIRRPRLTPGCALAGNAIAFMSLYLAAGALMPLLVDYQAQWDLSAVLVAEAFAVFAIGFLATVITVGSLSDHAGRRPVLIGALMIQLASDIVLLVAPDISWVIIGRIVQGAATGAATPAFTAALVELAPASRKRLGTILGSICLTGGVAFGSLLAGITLQLTTAANSIVFSVLIATTMLGILVVALSPESAVCAPGALRSLLPKVAVPPSAQKEFVAAAPAITAIWMLSSFSGGLAPSMMHSVFHLDSGLLNGVCGFVAPAASALTGLSSTRVEPRRLIAMGMCASIAGPIGIAAGASAGNLAVMFVGLIVGGAGFGASFAAALRLVLPLAATPRRAEVASAIYLVSYFAFGAPVVVAGKLTEYFGIVSTVAGFSSACALLAVASLWAQFRLARAHQARSVADSSTRAT